MVISTLFVLDFFQCSHWKFWSFSPCLEARILRFELVIPLLLKCLILLETTPPLLLQIYLTFENLSIIAVSHPKLFFGLNAWFQVTMGECLISCFTAGYLGAVTFQSRNIDGNLNVTFLFFFFKCHLPI